MKNLKLLIKQHILCSYLQLGNQIKERDGRLIYCGDSNQSFDNGILDFNVRDTSNFIQNINTDIQFFTGLKKNFEWKYYSLFHPEWVKDILKQNDFIEGDPEALFLFDIDNDHLVSISPKAIITKEINTDSEFEQVVVLLNTVWHSDYKNFIKNLRNEIEKSSGHVKIFGAFLNDKLISVGWIRMYGKIGYLFGGSTLPDYRKQGAFSALLQLRLKVAHQNSCQYLMVDASPDSERILNKVGFKKIGTTIAFIKNNNF